MLGLTNKLLGQETWGPHGNGTGGFLELWDVRERLHLLHGIPTLSIGAEDDIVAPEDVHAMSKALGGDYAFMPDAGHFSFVDQRDLWLRSFQDWLHHHELESQPDVLRVFAKAQSRPETSHVAYSILGLTASLIAVVAFLVRSRFSACMQHAALQAPLLGVSR